MPKTYTFEMATNTARGLIKIGDREFVDRRFTLKEKKSGTLQSDTVVGFVVIALNLLKVKPDPVTPEWIEETLTSEELDMLFNWCLNGELRPTAPAPADDAT